MTTAQTNYVAKRRHQFVGLTAKLDAMSPLKVLGRGYAMVQTNGGEIVKSWRDAPAGASVTVTLGEGGLACTVDKPLKPKGEKQ